MENLKLENHNYTWIFLSIAAMLAIQMYLFYNIYLKLLRNVTYRQCVLKLAKISRYFIPDIKNEHDAVLVEVEVNYLIFIHGECI